jgi:solute carrier family 13 (sodium-dependent dicarboxylate transporter), member 2/3/5
MTEGVRSTGTYKTLAEQREVLTPAEQKFEKARQMIGLFLGPVVFLVMYFLPLEPNQQTLAAILSFMTVYWLSEAIPIPATAILVLALAVVLVKLLPGVCCHAS